MRIPSRKLAHRAPAGARVALSLCIACALFVRPAAPAPAGPDSAAPRATPALKLPPDGFYARTVGPDSGVVFSHRTHVQYEGNSCTGCHPKHFKLLAPVGTFAHHDMNAGLGCGACHDGRKAFGVRESAACLTCHTGRKPTAVAAGASVMPPESRIPKPFFYPRGGDSPGVVTFKHETHARDKCATCHPKLFPMKITPARPDGAMHEAGSCGACHDGKKAFDVESPDLCDKCHVEPRGGGR